VGTAEPGLAGEHSRARRDVQRVMFVGASVTRGWFASSLSRAFPERVSAMLPTEQQDVLWTVLADPGAPVDVAERWQLRRNQDIVVVHVVSDDFLYGTPLREYDMRYRTLLRRILDASPRARLVCLGDWGRIGAVNRLGTVAYSYDRVVDAACASHGGTYVPINQNYDVPGARGPSGRRTGFGISDDFHPNDFGHMLIAQTVMQGLQGHPPAEPVPAPGAPSEQPVLPRPTPGTPPDTRSGRKTQ
jgi:lysophospholipase L1-like esterase